MSLMQLVERELNRKMEELSEGSGAGQQQGSSRVAVFQVRPRRGSQSDWHDWLPAAVG